MIFGLHSESGYVILPSRVCLKYAAGVEVVAALRREDSLHRHDLAELAGVAVPQTYGFFTGGTMTAPIGCLIMELCMSTEMLKIPDNFCRLAFWSKATASVDNVARTPSSFSTPRTCPSCSSRIDASFDRSIHESTSLKQILRYSFRNLTPRWNIMDIISLLETTFNVENTRWYLFHVNNVVPPREP